MLLALCLCYKIQNYIEDQNQTIQQHKNFTVYFILTLSYRLLTTYYKSLIFQKFKTLTIWLMENIILPQVTFNKRKW